MIYIGIDQSYSGFGLVGYNLETGDHQAVLGKFDPKKYGTGIDRLYEIDQWLEEEISGLNEGRPSLTGHVCMEGYAPGSKFGREKAGELGATVKMTLRNCLPDPVNYPTIVSPTGLKKYVLGKAASGKNVMLLGVYKKWGVEFANDNLADAYALARIAAAMDGGGSLVYERDVISALTRHTERLNS